MTAEHDPIERQVFVPARPETVFRFLIEPELMARWIGRVQFAAAEEGVLFRLQFTFGEGHTAAGVFIEISPPQRLAFSFGWEGDDTFPPGTSLVEIHLHPQADGTVLELKHSGFPDATEPKFTPENHADHWSHYLSGLAETVLRVRQAGCLLDAGPLAGRFCWETPGHTARPAPALRARSSMPSRSASR